MKEKKTVGYYAGVVFGVVITACMAAILVGATVKVLYWMF